MAVIGDLMFGFDTSDLLVCQITFPTILVEQTRFKSCELIASTEEIFTKDMVVIYASGSFDASILAGKINELDETANAKTMKEAIVALKASLKGE